MKRRTIDAVEESNGDIATKVKIRFELGEEKAAIIIGELDKIRKEFNIQKSSDGYGHAFEIFAIAVLYNIDYDYVLKNYIVDGKYDGKIDAIYWKGNKNYIYQIKLDLIEDFSDIETMKKNYRQYVRGEDLSNDKTVENFLEFCSKYDNELNREKDCEFVTISNNNTLTKNIEPIEIFKMFFENILICKKERDMKLSLSVPDTGIAKLDDDIYLYIESAKKFIDELLKCENINYKEDNLYKYFHDNVRGNLGENENIINTIENEPYNFLKYNNGVTITGDVEYNPHTSNLVIKNPIINNGQQTVCNLVTKHPHIDNVNLIIVVKNENDPQVKLKISEYTNSQRKISSIDLLSLNFHLREIQSKIFEKTIVSTNIEDRYFLDLNSTGTKQYQSVARKIYLRNNIISLTSFCRLYYSVTEKKKLGEWKNNISRKISEIDLNNKYEETKSLKVCSIIKRYNDYLLTLEKQERDKVKCADLAFMYIMFKYNLDEKATHKIITKINKKYYFDLNDSKRPSKLIDLYKVNSIIDKIEEFCK